MIRNFFRAALAAWRSISFVATVLAILWFWPDIRDLPKAYGFDWGQIMPDRETVALALLFVALLWILWVDARPSIRRWLRARKQPPIVVAWGEHPIWADKEDGQLFAVWPLRIRNTTKAVVDGVEVTLNSIVRKGPSKGVKEVHGRLCLRNTFEKSFDMLPGMPRDLLLFRMALREGPPTRIEFGKVEGLNTFIGFGPGLYKLYISIFARTIEPIEVTLGVTLDPTGAISIGRWRDDLPWPLSPPKPAANLAPQSPQGTEAETPPKNRHG